MEERYKDFIYLKFSNSSEKDNVSEEEVPKEGQCLSEKG